MASYVKSIVDKYSLPDTLSQTETSTVYDPLCRHLDNWAIRNGYSLNSKKLSGSRAKGTYGVSVMGGVSFTIHGIGSN